MEQRKSNPIFKNAMANGPIMGACFIGFFVCSAMSASSAILSLLGFVLMCMPPFLLFFLLKRSQKRAGGQLTFSLLWLEGVLTMVFGSIFLAIITFIYLRWVNPSFISDQLTSSLAVLEQLGQGYESLAESMRQIIKSGDIPSPLSVAGGLIQSAFLTGTILAAIIAAIVRAIKIKKQ